ncbi:hypothetical protein F5878DRAFT_639999 [Lentinula raphanica]|uniref:Uncharacterized protein n=1 Tax=Lentinula raphanica TaxID=153919 RepID=A0AA38PE17_9AGAR|nr:hypothetical protein F5878DRAFT_639999 [Lentinula raphanica]
MSITLPPLPAMPSPSKHKRNDNKLRPITDTLKLKREMLKAIKVTVRNNPPVLGPTLSSTNGMQHLSRFQKRRYKAAVIDVLKSESQFVMPWADELFREFSMESLKKQLPTIFTFAYPKKSAIEIEEDVDMFMVRVGQRHHDLNEDELRDFLVFCSQDFGYLYRRWHPTEDVDASPEMAIRRNEYVRFDVPHPRASSATSPTLPDSPSKPKAKKRAREEDESDCATIIKRAKKGFKCLVSNIVLASCSFSSSLVPSLVLPFSAQAWARYFHPVTKAIYWRSLTHLVAVNFPFALAAWVYLFVFTVSYSSKQNSTALHYPLTVLHAAATVSSSSSSSSSSPASSVHQLIAAYPIFTRTRPPSASELESGEALVSEEVREGSFYRNTYAMFTDSTSFQALFYFLVIKPAIMLLFTVFFLVVRPCAGGAEGDGGWVKSGGWGDGKERG